MNERKQIYLEEAFWRIGRNENSNFFAEFIWRHHGHFFSRHKNSNTVDETVTVFRHRFAQNPAETTNTFIDVLQLAGSFAMSVEH